MLTQYEFKSMNLLADLPEGVSRGGLTSKHALLQIDQHHAMLVELSDMTGEFHLGQRIGLTRDR